MTRQADNSRQERYERPKRQNVAERGDVVGKASVRESGRKKEAEGCSDLAVRYGLDGCVPPNSRAAILTPKG